MKEPKTSIEINSNEIKNHNDWIRSMKRLTKYKIIKDLKDLIVPVPGVTLDTETDTETETETEKNPDIRKKYIRSK